MNKFLTTTYINPLTDFGFKKLFASESNKELLIDFLNEIIKEEGGVMDIQYQRNRKINKNRDGSI
jgi:hypothetical protein